MSRMQRVPVRTRAKKKIEDAYPREFRAAKNIEILMLEHRMTRAEVGQYLGWSDTTMWRRLTKSPWEITISELYALCDLWGVTLEAFQREPLVGAGAEVH